MASSSGPRRTWQESPANSLGGGHSVCILLFKATWVTQYFLAFYAHCFAVRTGWLFLLALNQGFSYFSHVCLQPLEGCILSLLAPKIWFGGHGPSIALTCYFFTWHFISLISHFPPLGYMCMCSFSHSHSHLLSLPLTSSGSQLRCQWWAQDVSGLGPSAWGCALQPLVHLATGLSPPEGHFQGGWDITAHLTFYGHQRQTQQF